MNNTRIFCGDFETTVFEGQTYTEVWCGALVELNTEDVFIFNSIDKTYNLLYNLARKENILVYFHNLKFDGSFWIDYIIRILKYEKACDLISQEPYIIQWCDRKSMENNTFQYSISDMGQWYSITIKVHDHFITFWDSLKLLPFSIKQIGKAFKTKHQKTTIEYTGYRKAGGVITPQEKEYIKNDVLVMKEAIEEMYKQGHKKMTIGGCCLTEFKSLFDRRTYKEYFPRLDEIPFDGVDFENYDEFIRKSYKGGWCYLKKGCENKIFKNGFTIDVNSLYPSMMSGESGNIYPVGVPAYFKGEPTNEIKNDKSIYWFVRLKCRFKVKKGYLPFIQIRGSWLYRSNEMLETSDFYDLKLKKHFRYYKDIDGEIKEAKPILVLTMTDYFLFLEHYDLFDVEYIDGCYFRGEKAGYIFDEYIGKYKKIKMENKGAIRTIAKLFLNNLYGKLATSKNSSFKVCYLNEKTDAISFHTVHEENKKVGYIPIGSAITSYARDFTIRTAQANYNNFIYADTDSCHCVGEIKDLKNAPLHPNAFNHWSVECQWEKAVFVRQKTYIEKVIIEDGEEVNPYYSIKCAGMNDKCKKIFSNALLVGEGENVSRETLNEYNEVQKNFILSGKTLKDFKRGLKIFGKLIPKRMKGGVVLYEDYFTIR